MSTIAAKAFIIANCALAMCGCSTSVKQEPAQSESYNPIKPAWHATVDWQLLTSETERYIVVLFGAVPNDLIGGLDAESVRNPSLAESEGFGLSLSVDAAITGHDLPFFITVDKGFILRRLDGELAGNVLPNSAVRSRPLPWTQDDASDLAREICELLYGKITKWKFSPNAGQAMEEGSTQYDIHFHTTTTNEMIWEGIATIDLNLESGTLTEFWLHAYWIPGTNSQTHPMR